MAYPDYAARVVCQARRHNSTSFCISLNPTDMNTLSKETRSTIIPTLRYRNASAAIHWLCEAFGFEKHLVVAGEGDEIAHAQLVFGNGMIMLGSARNDDFGKLQQPLASIEQTVAQSPYIIVTDVDAHYQQAIANGARVEREPEDQPQGGRLYTCRDPEGNLWNFGSYDPWEFV